jgi:hypothetical protein
MLKQSFQDVWRELKLNRGKLFHGDARHSKQNPIPARRHWPQQQTLACRMVICILLNAISQAGSTVVRLGQFFN